MFKLEKDLYEVICLTLKLLNCYKLLLYNGFVYFKCYIYKYYLIK